MRQTADCERLRREPVHHLITPDDRPPRCFTLLLDPYRRPRPWAPEVCASTYSGDHCSPRTSPHIPWHYERLPETQSFGARPEHELGSHLRTVAVSGRPHNGRLL